MASQIPLKKFILLYFKYRLRYWSFRRKTIALSEPQLSYGLTDHPLDRFGDPTAELFSFVQKQLARTPRAILRVELQHQEGNSFLFRATAYNIKMIKRNLNVLYIDFKPDSQKKVWECTLALDVLTPTTYRLRLARGSSVPVHETPMVCANITQCDFQAKMEDSYDSYAITTPNLHLRVFKDNFRIEVFDSKGNAITTSGSRSHNEFINAMDSFPLGFVQNRSPKRLYAVENFNLAPNEAIYGFGERFTALNKVGQTIPLWIYEGSGNCSARGYKHIPFFLSSRGYGVFFNESRPLTFWVGTRETTKIQVAAEGNLLDYYFFYGPSPKEVLGQYTALTGRASVPPRWSFGAWMSRLSYSTQDEVLAVARRLREGCYPMDVIHIDTNWFEHDWACDWKFDPKRFPDPASMFRECAKMGFKISLWQVPYVVDNLAISKDAKLKHALARNGGPFMFSMSGPAHAIDFSRPEGVTWYQEKLRALFELGAKVIKVDFGEEIENHQQFALGDGRLMHNLFPLLYNKAAFEATKTALGRGQAVIWARSAYAGSQRYPVHWSGDNSSNFPNLFTSMRGGLSLGLCGFTFWSQDIGGFVGIPDDKLYARWTAMSIFQSHIRYHGNPPRFREPWNYSPEAQDAVRKLLELRYRLIPYLYSEGIQSAMAGLPLMRALLLEFPGDALCYHIEDQFCCGEKLLVAPLLSESDTRRVYLPSGEWINFWTGENTKGPAWVEVEPMPWDKIPVFVRAGSFLPLGDVTQYVPDGLPSHLTLLVYPDHDGNANYDLHDEQGVVQIRGTGQPQKYHLEVVYVPMDRQKYTIEVKFGLGAASSPVEIVEK